MKVVLGLLVLQVVTFLHGTSAFQPTGTTIRRVLNLKIPRWVDHGADEQGFPPFPYGSLLGGIILLAVSLIQPLFVLLLFVAVFLFFLRLCFVQSRSSDDVSDR